MISKYVTTTKSMLMCYTQDVTFEVTRSGIIAVVRFISAPNLRQLSSCISSSSGIHSQLCPPFLRTLRQHRNILPRQAQKLPHEMESKAHTIRIPLPNPARLFKRRRPTYRCQKTAPPSPLHCEPKTTVLQTPLNQGPSSYSPLAYPSTLSRLRPA